MANETPTFRPLPAVHAAALELHRVLVTSLRNLSRGDAGPLERAPERAARAIEQANAGVRRTQNLGRAREAIVTVVASIRIYRAEQLVSEELKLELFARSQQILAGLELLEETRPELWPRLPLLPFPGIPSGPRLRLVN